MAENQDLTLKPALDRILFLASYYFLDKHLIYFYQGGYFTNEKPVTLIRSAIIELSKEMKSDAVGLVS